MTEVIDQPGEDVPTPAKKSIGMRILHFPLVAMVLGVLVYILGQILAGGIAFATGTSLEDLADPATSNLNSLLVAVFVFVLYKLLIVRLGAHKRDDLPIDGRMIDAPIGFAEGALIFSAIVAVAFILNVYQPIELSPAEDWLPILLATGLMAGLTEEILFRGVIFRFLEELGGSWVALALSALLFGFAHALNPAATAMSSISIAVAAGLLLGGAYMYTRNLWLAVGIHAGWNVTQGLVWDIPVSGLMLDGFVESRLVGPEWLSGGQFGLEASVLTMVIAGLAGIWFIVLAGRRGRIVNRHWWSKPRGQVTV